MTTPNKILAGDTLSFVNTISEYSDDDGYTANFVLNSASVEYSFAASGVGTEFTFAQTAAQTALWVAGKYTYLIYSAKAAERFTIERGEIDIKADIVGAGGVDVRTHAQKVLDAICAVLEKRASSDQRDFQLAGGVSISKLDHGDLLSFKRQYENIRRKEIEDENIKNGKTHGNIIKARLL